MSLEKLSPDAFPVFFEIEVSEKGRDHAEIIVDFAAPEDRATLLKIYTDAGKQLHVGSLRALQRGGKRYVSADIATARNFIVNLLNNHAIVLPGMREVLLTYMQHGDRNNVTCQIVSLENPARIDLSSTRRRPH